MQGPPASLCTPMHAHAHGTLQLCMSTVCHCWLVHVLLLWCNRGNRVWFIFVSSGPSSVPDTEQALNKRLLSEWMTECPSARMKACRNQQMTEDEDLRKYSWKDYRLWTSFRPPIYHFLAVWAWINLFNLRLFLRLQGGDNICSQYYDVDQMRWHV